MCEESSNYCLRLPHRDLPEIHGNYKCYQFLPPANPFITYSAKYIRVIWGLGYIEDNGLGCFIKMSHFFPQLTDCLRKPWSWLLNSAKYLECLNACLPLKHWANIWNQIETLWKLSTEWSYSKTSTQWDKVWEKENQINYILPNLARLIKLIQYFI